MAIDPIDPKLIDTLLKGYKNPEEIIGKSGLLKQLTKALLERALNAELTEHVGLQFIPISPKPFARIHQQESVGQPDLHVHSMEHVERNMTLSPEISGDLNLARYRKTQTPEPGSHADKSIFDSKQWSSGVGASPPRFPVSPS